MNNENNNSQLICEVCGIPHDGKYASGRFCSRKCSNTRHRTNETKLKIARSLLKFNNENKKELTFSKTGAIQNKICKECKKEYILDLREKVREVTKSFCSPHCRHAYCSKHCGGQRNRSGYGIKGWYKGIYCDSSWELAYVIYMLDKHKSISRCTEIRTYIFNGKINKYFPDFITEDGIVEIKGYTSKQWLAKFKYNHDVIVLDKIKIKPFLEYAIATYGIDFVRLYDNSNPKNQINKFAWLHKINIGTSEYVSAFVAKKDISIYVDNNWVNGRFHEGGQFIKIKAKLPRRISPLKKEELLSSFIS